jgi:hypothetical protein
MPNPAKTPEELAKAVDEANANYSAAISALETARNRRRKLQSDLSDAISDQCAAATRADVAAKCLTDAKERLYSVR